MLEFHKLNFSIGLFINLTNDLFNTLNIRGPIRNNQYIGVRIGGQMSLLRNQWSQHWHQLGGIYIFDQYDPGNQLITIPTLRLQIHRCCILFGGGIRDNFYRIIGRNGRKAMHLQNR